jgi:hypothetical protein
MISMYKNFKKFFKQNWTPCCACVQYTVQKETVLRDALQVTQGAGKLE